MGEEEARRRDSSRFVKKANATKRSVIGPESKYNCLGVRWEGCSQKETNLSKLFLFFFSFLLRNKRKSRT